MCKARVLLQQWPWLLVAGGWLGTISLLSFLGPPYGVDAYFHLQVADVMRERGLTFGTFPYASESMWQDSYFDKEWLFHVILVPLIGWFGKVGAGQWGILFLNLLLVVGVWYCLRLLEVPKAWFWAGLMPCAVFGMMWLRLTLLRPHLLAAPIFLVAIAAALRRRHVVLGLMAMLYSFSHTAHWQLPFMIAALDGVALIWPEDRAKRFRRIPMVLVSLVGIGMGTVLHPHFPANLSGLYVQNVRVLQAYWDASPVLLAVKPVELRPLGAGIFGMSVPLLFCLSAVCLRVVRGQVRWHQDLSVLTIYALGYMVMTMKSARFIDYYAPCAVLFFACWFRQHPWREHVERRWQRVVLCCLVCGYFVSIGGLAIGLLILAVYGWLEWREYTNARQLVVVMAFALLATSFTLGGLRQHVGQRLQSQTGQPPFAEAGKLLAEHLEPGDLVFTTNWPEPAWLWFSAPEQRYMMFLEPMFCYLRSAERFELWHQTRIGRVEDPVSSIRDVFGARAAVVYGKGSEPLRQRLEQHPEVVTLPFVGPTGEKIYLFPRAHGRN